MNNSFFNNKTADYLEGSQFEDFRGSSTKFFQNDTGIPVCQALINRTPKKKTLRGLHTQLGKMAEEKIIHCISGELVWFAINYSDYTGTGAITTKELRLISGQTIYVPKHHLNGMISLSDGVSILILASRPFDQEAGINVSPFDGLFFGEILNDFGVDKSCFDQKSGMVSQHTFLKTLTSNTDWKSN